jgi:uncharacterized membrane protein
MMLVAAVVGAILGVLVDASGGLGFVAGGLIGLLLGGWLEQRQRLAELRLEIDGLRRSLIARGARERPLHAESAASRESDRPAAEPATDPRTVTEAPASASAPMPPRGFTPFPEPEPELPPPLPPARPAPPTWTSTSRPAPIPQAAPPPLFRDTAAEPDHAEAGADDALSAGREPPVWQSWLTLENWPIKLGLLLLLIGVGAGLRWVAMQGWLTVPMSVRLIGLYLLAGGALAFGLRQPPEKRAFGLSVQGAALGVMLMTVYAALRLYGLIEPGPAFGLMLATVVLGVLLAVRQDALWLALFASGAGYFTPIWTSSGQGSHVQLFAFYGLLTAAVTAIAMFRRWRALNLLAFLCVYGVGIAWGAQYYQPAYFDSVAPFVVGYFLAFVAIAVLYALKHGSRGDVVDGTLVFGTPVGTAVLLAGLLDSDQQLAVAAVLAAALYLTLWWNLEAREDLALLGQSFLVLGVVLLIAAVPLALGAAWTGAVWALVGVGVLWVGMRQQSVAYVISGYAMLGMAMLAYLSGYDGSAGNPPWLNADFIGALTLALACFAAVRISEDDADLKGLTLLAFLLGLPWWVLAFTLEVPRALPPSLQAEGWVVVAALTVGLSAIADRLTGSLWLGRVANLVLLVTPLIVVIGGTDNVTPLSDRGWLAFGAYAIAALFAMNELREPQVPGLGWAATGWLLGLVLLAGWEAQHWLPIALLSNTRWAAEVIASRGRLSDPGWAPEDWRAFFTLLPTLMLLWAARFGVTAHAWPLADRYDYFRRRVEWPLLALVMFGAVLALSLPGTRMGETWLPIFNQVELYQLLAIALLVRVWAQHRNDSGSGILLQSWLLLGWLAISAAVLRTVHHWLDERWMPLSCDVAQASLSIVWSAMGILAMLAGHRRGQRAAWVGGATLMGLVVAKLALVDRHALSQLAGVVAFLGVGGLLAVVGYFAPAPPAAGAPPRR